MATLPDPALVSAARFIGSLDRRTLASFVEVGITLLDALDGDADLETNDAEDDFAFTVHALRWMDDGPGCPIADPGGDNVEDDGEPEEGV